MDKLDAFQELILSQPLHREEGDDDYDILDATIQEYIRINEYQQLKNIFEKNYPDLPFDLWVWANGLVSLGGAGRKDPLLFYSKENSMNYADIILFGDREIVASERFDMNKAFKVYEKIWSENKNNQLYRKALKVSEGETEITFRRKGMAGFNIPYLLIDKLDYQHLLSLIEPEIDEDVKNIIIERYLLRISAIQSSLKSAALPSNYYRSLKKIAVNSQLFATPLDHEFDNYGSEFHDVDKPFGSFGSIMKDETAVDALRAGGSFEANLINYGPLHTIIVAKIDDILSKSKKSITVFIVHDISHPQGQEQHTNLSTYVRNATYLPRIQTDGSSSNTRNFLVLQSPKSKMLKEQDFFNIFNTLIEETSINERRVIQTLPILTCFEKAVAVGKRAEQLALGAESTIKIPEGIIDVLIVAEMELEQRKMPMIISRPDRDWDINELIDYDSGNYLYDMGPSSLKI